MSAQNDRSPPRPSSPATFDVVRQVGGDKLHLVFLNEAPTLVACHWDGQTVPHIDGAGACRYCEMGQAIKVEGFIGAWDLTTRKVVVVGLSRGACQDAQVIACQYSGLRGVKVLCYRQSNRSNGKGRIAFVERFVITRFPDPIDVLPTVAELWGLPSPHLLYAVPWVVDAPIRTRADGGAP